MQAAALLLGSQKEAYRFFKNPTSWLVLSATIAAASLLVYTIALNQIAMIVMAALSVVGSLHTMYLQVKVVRLASLSEINHQMAFQVSTLATNTGALSNERHQLAQLQTAFNQSNREHGEKIEALLSEIQEKSTLLALALEESQQLAKNITEIQNERIKWESFAKDAEGKLDRFEKANKCLSKDVAALQNDKVELQNQNEKLSKLQTQFARENEALQEGLQELQNTLEALKQELAIKRDLQPLIDTAKKMVDSTLKWDSELKRAEELQKRVDADIEQLKKISLPLKNQLRGVYT